jgi:hypothetical protein
MSLNRYMEYSVKEKSIALSVYFILAYFLTILKEDALLDIMSLNIVFIN